MKWIQVCESEVEFRLSTTTLKAMPETYRSRIHSHPFVEWGMVLEGECEWVAEGQEYPVAENGLMLLPSECVHMERIHEGKRARLSWLGFAQAQSTVGLRPLVLDSGRWATELRRLFVSLFEEQSESGYGRERRIDLCMHEILLLVGRCMHEQYDRIKETSVETHKIPLRQAQLAHAIAQYFENNMATPIRMGEVAHYFQLSPQHFSVLFQRVYGMTPIKYLQQVRQRWACHWLSQSDRAIKEIAIDCGYPDAAYFCRQFVRQMGCNPSEYRLRHLLSGGMVEPL